MDPLSIFVILSILAPLILLFTFFVPLYVGVWSALYWIYFDDDTKRQKVEAMRYDVSHVIGQYQQLYEYWLQHSDADFFSLTLPLFLPPSIGTLLGILFTYKAAKSMRDVFRVT